MSRFVSESGDLSVARSQCELCKHYNDGAYSDCCPREFLAQIQKNEIGCPAFQMPGLEILNRSDSPKDH